MSSYRIKLSSSTVSSPVFLDQGVNGGEILDVFNSGFNDSPSDPRRVADTDRASIPLIRRGARDFADELGQALINMLENFTSPIAPKKPLAGQLWYDVSADGPVLKVCVTPSSVPSNVVWQKVHASTTGFNSTPVSVTLTGAVNGTGSVNPVTNTASVSTSLQPIVSPGNYQYPTSISVDAGGRVTQVVGGGAPTEINPNAYVKITGDTMTGSLNVVGKVRENGNDLVPRGIVAMWTGSASNIPAGWVLCDGNNGTHNLRDRFVIAAGSGFAPGATGGANSAGGSATLTTSAAGSHSHTGEAAAAGNHDHGGSVTATALTIDQMPSHQHATNWGESNGRPYPQYGAVGGQNGPRNNIGSRDTDFDNWNYLSEAVGGGQGHGHAITGSGNHTHAVSFSTDGNHTHTVTLSGGALPPYYALCYIMKT